MVEGVYVLHYVPSSIKLTGLSRLGHGIGRDLHVRVTPRCDGRARAGGNSAATESFFSRLEKNVLDLKTSSSQAALREEIVRSIKVTCHFCRSPRAPGRLTPIEDEAIDSASNVAWNVQAAKSTRAMAGSCTS